MVPRSGSRWFLNLTQPKHGREQHHRQPWWWRSRATDLCRRVASRLPLCTPYATWDRVRRARGLLRANPSRRAGWCDNSKIPQPPGWVPLCVGQGGVPDRLPRGWPSRTPSQGDPSDPTSDGRSRRADHTAGLCGRQCVGISRWRPGKQAGFGSSTRWWHKATCSGQAFLERLFCPVQLRVQFRRCRNQFMPLE